MHGPAPDLFGTGWWARPLAMGEASDLVLVLQAVRKTPWGCTRLADLALSRPDNSVVAHRIWRFLDWLAVSL